MHPSCVEILGIKSFVWDLAESRWGISPFIRILAVSRTHAWVMGKVAMTSGPIAYPKHWQQRFSSRPNWLSWSVWHPQVRMDLSKPSWNISCARRASVVPRLNCDLIMHGRVVGTKRTGPHRHVNMAGFEKHHWGSTSHSIHSFMGPWGLERIVPWFQWNCCIRGRHRHIWSIYPEW